jgi:hypothetical protein
MDLNFGLANHQAAVQVAFHAARRSNDKPRKRKANNDEHHKQAIDPHHFAGITFNTLVV